MEIRIDNLEGPEIQQLLRDHLNDMHTTSPIESCHALDLDGLKKPEITFWSVWKDGTLLGCGALKALDSEHAEVKSMRTTPAARKQGIASKMLLHILNHAKAEGFSRISLETGPQDFFLPARQLYTKHGFQLCGPFGDYKLDPYSVFMTKDLS